ncbi:MAG: TetR/AcrR family transcriptional regulator [Actinomycetes bacterium]
MSTSASTPPAAPIRRRPRVRSVDARKRLIDTTIAMLRVQPFSEVTTRRITKQAGLPLSALSRNFGSLYGLFDAVAKALLDNFTSAHAEYTALDVLSNPDVVLRTRLIAWIIGQGGDPVAFRPVGESRSNYIAERQQRLTGASPRMAIAWAEIVTFIVEGYAVFSETHRPIGDPAISDAMVVMFELQKSLRDLELQLGWNEN